VSRVNAEQTVHRGKKNVPERLPEQNVPNCLSHQKCSGQSFYRRKQCSGQTVYHSKNKKFPQRLFMGAKYSGQIIAQKKIGQAMYGSKMFRTNVLSEKNVPDRLFIGATNTANEKLHTKLVQQLYFP
jgi:hypothetical protein